MLRNAGVVLRQVVVIAVADYHNELLLFPFRCV